MIEQACDLLSIASSIRPVVLFFSFFFFKARHTVLFLLRSVYCSSTSLPASARLPTRRHPWKIAFRRPVKRHVDWWRKPRRNFASYRSLALLSVPHLARSHLSPLCFRIRWTHDASFRGTLPLFYSLHPSILKSVLRVTPEAGVSRCPRKRSTFIIRGNRISALAELSLTIVATVRVSNVLRDSGERSSRWQIILTTSSPHLADNFIRTFYSATRQNWRYRWRRSKYSKGNRKSVVIVS